MRTGYLAPIGLESQLRAELKNIVHEYDRLFIAEGPVQKVYWAQNIWLDPQVISFTSISDGAKKLRSLQKLWSFYPYTNHRRGQLISSQLRYFSPKPFVFPSSMPTAALGSWTLLDESTILASPHCTSTFSQGEVVFEESKIPPSRAYLKLWEAFTKIGKMPSAQERCLEIGASPGSWTWVLQSLGAEVIAVDKAPLHPQIAKLPNIVFLKKDAFSLCPEDFSDIDWIFSDVICYPEKLLSWVQKWLTVCPHINMICTIKFQGNPEYGIVKEFEKIEGSFVQHLFHNKHELTWIKVGVDKI